MVSFTSFVLLNSANRRILGVPSMLTATYDNHARVRRLFSPAFSDRALKKQEPLFRK